MNNLGVDDLLFFTDLEWVFLGLILVEILGFKKLPI